MLLHRWLASNGQLTAAEGALRSLRGPEGVEADVSDMLQAVESESKLQSWPLLHSPVVRAELKVGESCWRGPKLRQLLQKVLVTHGAALKQLLQKALVTDCAVCSSCFRN